jgi:hypothetical protein
LGNIFVFYVNHTTIEYLVDKPHVFGRIARWLIFLECKFTIVCKLSKTQLVADVLSILSNSSKPLGVLN